MNNLLQKIFEVTALPISFKGKKFFYGVDNRIEALNIWNSGKIPLFSKHSGYKDRSYISPNIEDACDYATSVLGKKYNKSLIKEKGRYGYIFIVSGKELTDIFPNESDVGRYVQELYDNQYSENDLEPASFRFLEWVWSILNREEQKSIIYDDKNAYHSLGKKILDSMSESQILWLLNKKSVRITNKGSVNFSNLYRVDRMSTGDFEPSGKDFFQKAYMVENKEEII